MMTIYMWFVAYIYRDSLAQHSLHAPVAVVVIPVLF